MMQLHNLINLNYILAFTFYRCLLDVQRNWMLTFLQSDAPWMHCASKGFTAVTVLSPLRVFR